LKALDEVHKTYTLLRAFALWDSNLKIKKIASGKLSPDEAEGPREETIRPQPSSMAWGSSEESAQGTLR